MTARHDDRLLAASKTRIENPFLTIAIPHYNQRPYLEVVLASILDQDFDSFEIVISDDGSTDDSNESIPGLLQRSGRSFRYYAQPANLGYDANVRFCLSAALGRYIFLLGNDDALQDRTVLQQVAGALRELELPDVAFVNYSDWSSGQVVRRSQSTRVLGSGPKTAMRFFRSFSFVSGLIYAREMAIQHETDRWDASIYYQIYLACRVLAAGGRLAALDVVAIRKDVKVRDRPVPNYESRLEHAGWSLAPRHTGLDSVIRVTADAILPFLSDADRSAALRQIVSQVLAITYPYWLFEYRRIGNWSVAAGVARGMWPHTLLAEYELRHRDKLAIWVLYVMVTLIGLSVPSRLFNRVRGTLADGVRRIAQSTSGQIAR